MRVILMLVAGTALAHGQPIGAGLKIGLPLSDTVDLVSNSFRTEKPGYTIGPFVEIRLPANLAIEFDALHEKLRFDHAGGATARVSSWQFPLLLKYRIGRSRIRPFVLGGVAAYYVGDIAATPQFSEFSRFGNSFFNGGGVLGGGVEVKLGPLRIGPEVRFTRWVVDKSAATPLATLRLNQSQTHFFLSASF